MGRLVPYTPEIDYDPAAEREFFTEVGYQQALTEHVVGMDPALMLAWIKHAHRTDLMTIVLVGVMNGACPADVGRWPRGGRRSPP